MTGSARLAPLVEGIARTNFGLVGDEPLDELHPLGLLLAQITEAGDPLAYAGAIFGDRPAAFADTRRPHLLVTYTVDDEVLPNISTHALLRTLGVPIAGPHLVEPEAISLIDAPESANLDGHTGVAVQALSPIAPRHPHRAADPRILRAARAISHERRIRRAGNCRHRAGALRL